MFLFSFLRLKSHATRCDHHHLDVTKESKNQLMSHPAISLFPWLSEWRAEFRGKSFQLQRHWRHSEVSGHTPLSPLRHWLRFGSDFLFCSPCKKKVRSVWNLSHFSEFPFHLKCFFEVDKIIIYFNKWWTIMVIGFWATFLLVLKNFFLI